MPPRQKEITWTPELAYAVGLITTDGCLSPDGRHLELTSNDQDLIETFKKCLFLANKITTKWSGNKKVLSFRVQFSNVTLYRWLVEIGLMPNKSKKLDALTVPDKFFFDFLRGHLDGDGSIKKYFDPVYPKSLRLYVNFASASLPHLLWLNKKIYKLGSIRGFFRSYQNMHTLTFGKKDSIMFLNRIYHSPNIPYLQRKFTVAEEFLNCRGGEIGRHAAFRTL